jgi:molybdenum cofactor cytidylyltransferase
VTSTVFSPVTLGAVQLRNRILMAPMTRARTPSTVPNAANATYYAQRAGAGLILTETDGSDPKLAAKGRRSTDARLKALGMRLAAVVTIPHETEAIAATLKTLPGDIALILTGSATSDLHDTAPEAVRRAGGEVFRFGMPVDPGNLLFHGRQAGRPVIGLPGCARSPALNGADWVLERYACGLDVSDRDVAAMGVGGLLKEIGLRPQLREPD